jgi:hypothetical protein
MQKKEKICGIRLLLRKNQECITTDLNQSLLQCNGNIPLYLQPKSLKSKVTPSAGKVMLTVFWDFQGVLLAHFQKHGEILSSASYYEVPLKFWDAIPRKLPGQRVRRVLLHNDNARPHTARATHETI